MKDKKTNSNELSLKTTKYICFFVSLLLGVMLVAVIEYISSELLIFWYMRTNNIVYRSDLTNDYGLGLLGLLLSVAVFTICFPISVYIVWKLLRKNIV
jgi:hypothetical protein